MSCLQLIHELKQSIWGCNASPFNLMDDLSQSLEWVSHGECISVYGIHLIGPMMSHDISY